MLMTHFFFRQDFYQIETSIQHLHILCTKLIFFLAPRYNLWRVSQVSIAKIQKCHFFMWKYMEFGKKNACSLSIYLLQIQEINKAFVRCFSF